MNGILIKRFSGNSLGQLVGLCTLCFWATMLGAAEPPTAQDPPPAERRAERSEYGGSFEGTFAYDSQVGYDYGQSDDNGKAAEYYSNNRGPGMRMPGKRSNPGDLDFVDVYYQGKLINDPTRSDYDNLKGYLEFHGYIGRQRYWRSRTYVPLRYDDFGEYQRFRYELGAYPPRPLPRGGMPAGGRH